MGLEVNITPGSASYFTGEDKALRFTVYDNATQAQIDDGSATAKDITGWSLSWMVKKRKTDADDDAQLEKTTGAGITLTTPGSGICTVALSDEDIASIKAGQEYYHELKRTDAGLENVLASGILELSQAVHR